MTNIDKEYNYFNGFSSETFKFLTQVNNENSKDWFKENRDKYELYLLNPMRKLVNELAPAMLSIDQRIIVDPVINKTISKLYRDTRFSKDKSLFRDNMWISFKRKREGIYSYPEFYFFIKPNYYEFGMGDYSAKKKIMDNIRNEMKNDSKRFINAISFLKDKKNQFIVKGDKYVKRIESGETEELNNWFQYKYFYFSCKRNPSVEFSSQGLVTELTNAFTKLAPVYNFLISCYY